MKSFGAKVKRELCKISETSKKSRMLLLRGLLYGARKRGGKTVISAENEQVLELYAKLTQEFGVPNNDSVTPPSGSDKEAGLFLRGVFLSCGTVSDPGKDYHLEIGVPDDKKLDALFTLINENGIAVKKSARKNKPILYIKESEVISDFLTYIGAGVNSMEVMNAKIFKEVRNNVNRAVNCEAANIGKTARAASRQIADIELIYKKKGKDFLPPELKQIAELRLNHFEMSLKEIGEECEPRLSRSGVFHRLEKIQAIADKLRGSGL